MKSPFERNYDRICISPTAQTVIGSINHAILQALATNARVLLESKEDGNMVDVNHVYIPSNIPIIDSNGNPVTNIPRLLRVTNRFVVSIKSEEIVPLLETESIKMQVRAFYMTDYDFGDVKISDKKEDGSIKVGFFMKKSAYSEEKEEQTMPKYVYKLNPVPTGASEKAVVPAYYTTAEAAETARECLWANGEISVKSDITRLTIDTDPPEYKGVILKAELLPPKHWMDDWDDLGAWYIDDYSRIEPISYEDYARLRYPDAIAKKDEFHEQELIDADSPADLKKWLPYISPEDNCGKRFFYVYFPDKMFRLARHSKGNVALMVSDAYKKFLKNFRDRINRIIGIPLPSVCTCCNKSEEISKTVDTTAAEIRDKYPDILMVKFSYPGGIKSRRDFSCWDLLKVWKYSKVVWSLDPKTLTDTVDYRNIEVYMGDGVIANVDLSLLFNFEDSLPLVVFGRDEAFLFTRYKKRKYEDDQKAHQFFVIETMYRAIKDGAFRVVRRIG